MKFFAYILILCVITSCAPTREMQLGKIQTVRSFHGSKEDVMNAIRFFIAGEEFNLKRFEPEFGQVLAGKLVDNKTLVMKLNIYLSDGGKTTVDAKFTFGNVEGSVTRMDEELLVDYYYRLFDLLEDRFPAPAVGK
jgi:hypothetical protein